VIVQINHVLFRRCTDGRIDQHAIRGDIAEVVKKVSQGPNLRRTIGGGFKSRVGFLHQDAVRQLA
jgi:hypothetical protein